MRRGQPRRSCLTVPASNPKMLAKARALRPDEVFLDLEDSVAVSMKAQARANAIEALVDGGWSAPTVAVRINGPATPYAYLDAIEVVAAAGAHVDAIVLPKVESVADVHWLDRLLDQLEVAHDLVAGRIGIEAQIESARSLVNVDEIAAASERLETLVFGPGDMIASLGLRTLHVGDQPHGYPGADAYHYVRMRILVAARAQGLQAIDGPYSRVHDLDGFRAASRSAAALGFDGTWVLHPGQIDVANEVFAPTRAEYERAEEILDAYDLATSVEGGARGAVMIGAEMIDEAARAMARLVAAKGRAAGLDVAAGDADPGVEPARP